MNRRTFLAQNAMGIGGVALAWLLNEDRLLATPGDAPRGNRSFDLALKQPHFEPRAKSMISLFMHGGPSHVDLLDPKPELTKRSGSEYRRGSRLQLRQSGQQEAVRQPWKFSARRPVRHRGFGTACRTWRGSSTTSAVIRSMHTDINGHERRSGS